MCKFRGNIRIVQKGFFDNTLLKGPEHSYIVDVTTLPFFADVTNCLHESDHIHNRKEDVISVKKNYDE